MMNKGLQKSPNIPKMSQIRSFALLRIVTVISLQYHH
jgi:hypothetical protein